MTTYDVPTATNPWGAHFAIAAGSDGNLWFTEPGGSAVGRVTPAGQVSQFSFPGQANPWGITAGPDGNLWVSDVSGWIWRLSPSGQQMRWPVSPAGAEPWQITTGPDGNVWFTLHRSDEIGRITPSGQITEFPLPTPDAYPAGIAAGPDGNLWFVEVAKIGRITPSGQITEFDLPQLGSSTGPSGASGAFGYPIDIAAGPDGNLWFTLYEAGMVGRITPAGQITEFSVPDAGDGPSGIAAGPDGNMWFTYSNGDLIGRITPSGQASVFQLPSDGSGPFPITAGPDGAMWFADQLDGRIGRITTGAVGPSLLPPSVAGSDREFSSQSCQIGSWATWAGQQPVEDGVQWLLDGSAIAGATSASYTPGPAEVGHQLSCVERVTYPLLSVTATATSASVRVIPHLSIIRTARRARS